MSRLKIFSLLVVLVVISATFVASKNNETSEWKTLFNGKDLNGWVVKIHHHELGDNYANTFRVIDGKIQVNYDS